MLVFGKTTVLPLESIQNRFGSLTPSSGHYFFNKADCCQFFIAQTTHCNTQIWRRHSTHTHTHSHRPEVAVNSTSAFNPSRIVPPPGSSRSSGQLLSARGPSEPSVSVRDGQECSVLFGYGGPFRICVYWFSTNAFCSLFGLL